MSDDTSTGPVLLYDGVCGFCNANVQMIIRHDHKGALRFAALQSDYGKAVIARHAELKNVDSMVLIERTPEGSEKVSYRSTGALRMAAYLGGRWKLFLIGYIIPRPVRDFIYDLIARYRYKLFGKYDTCAIPSPEVRSRFLDIG
jgi:predicted DCC family thiol-disulfide oxidoreductase YuxK